MSAALEEQLDSLQNDLSFLEEAAGAGDEDAMEMKPIIEQQVAELKAQIKAQKASAPPPPPPADDAPPPPPKFQQHAPPPPPEEARATVFNVHDSIMAKYAVDKQWYAATIIAKTGSSTDPVYTVKFTGYPDKETKRKHEVRAIVDNSKKRKAEGPPAAASAAPPPPSPMQQTGTVISAAPSIDPTLVQKREPSKVSDGPTRMAPAPKKLKGNRTLEKAKSSWNDWQKTGPKKPVLGAAGKKLGKDSQFRTPDLPNAKVGFTGSGKPMSKDQVRAKWNYGKEEPEAD
ncbi:Hypothetical predicted protein [Lecanosticta acicola]|uniref:Tudor domain-containing protein n=1 Tax=Lecanosticta acicola TaxID=111012 RepID=A0AAI9EEW6_9PEZI|nr:Hypothetical predicted protein [Lecanosticta acicola]